MKARELYWGLALCCGLALYIAVFGPPDWEWLRVQYGPPVVVVLALAVHRLKHSGVKLK